MPATIRIHAPTGTDGGLHEVRIFLRAPEGVDARYELASATEEIGDEIPAGQATEETLVVCVGPRTPADVTVVAPTSTLIEGPPLTPEPAAHRLVGVQVGQVTVEPLGRPCDGP